ncbi:hypothetical protein [Mesorhizobium sp. 1B3]|uniref:hypothetical protein n=1 Tax=Mesorhizobium sp. 1B3 TaxID=3243599 RepID=UPI003D99E066
MRPHRPLLALSVLTAWTLPAGAEPLTTMEEVGTKILSCWSPPAGAQNSVVSMRFSFKRDGSLVGPPRPANIDVAGDEDQRKQFIAAAAEAIKHCTPVELAPDLAQGIGGQVFTLQFATGDREQTPMPQ